MPLNKETRTSYIPISHPSFPVLSPLSFSLFFSSTYFSSSVTFLSFLLSFLFFSNAFFFCLPFPYLPFLSTHPFLFSSTFFFLPLKNSAKKKKKKLDQFKCIFSLFPSLLLSPFSFCVLFPFLFLFILSLPLTFSRLSLFLSLPLLFQFFPTLIHSLNFFFNSLHSFSLSFSLSLSLSLSLSFH